ncbi:hypothetical protein TrCOL_g3517 [Triparma columacea]|uniref:Serine hydrolase domain-containing protein n=1 Tax=Triparma columacea TaxID=722753 RepID=A0A9W7FXL6_9STRA|nr:hypothetical protein TrCOL_g3517 [Triparma columacea]
MSSEDPERLAGLDASLLWLTQCWNANLDSNPFHGILAFSQGASLAGMLPLVTSPHYLFRNLHFLILINGYNPTPPPNKGFGGVPASKHSEANIINIPTLHIMGASNSVVQPSESIDLTLRFVEPIVYTHPHGHCLPSTVECFDLVASFLSLRYANLFLKQDPAVLEMRSRLRRLEAYAGSVIASESGSNPPRALMAVIDRNAVGGWSGGRRVEPGGGAPCPVEFVRKEKERREGGDRRKPEGKGE